MNLIKTLYIEKELRYHLRTQKIEKKFPKAKKIYCDRYQEIFNRKNQSYHLQKEKRALILAKKNDNFVQSLPFSPGIGKEKNYYFSLLYNCPFFCSYCFLQGFYRSSHFLCFINFKDFFEEIASIDAKNEEACFFCSHDGDLLSCDHFGDFIEELFPFFARCENSLFELRTKSVNISPLLKRKPLKNVVIACSLAPNAVIAATEKNTPSFSSRLSALKKLTDMGWQVGLRLDPIIYHEGYEKHYQKLIDEIFHTLPLHNIHSITIGLLRFSNEVYRQIVRYKTDPILFSPLLEKDKVWSYDERREEEIFSNIKKWLKDKIEEEKIFLYHRGC